MDPQSALGTGKTAVKAGKILQEKSKNFLNELKPYKPSVKNMTINYQNRSCEYKVLLIIPDELKRKVNHVELPKNFELMELYDGDSLDKLNLEWQEKNGRYKIRASKFPSSEKYFAILKGKIDEKLLGSIVNLSVASNPKKEKLIDKYWIQSMIRDVSILEVLWDELNIKNVDCKVRVGVDRCFSTNIPLEFKEKVDASRDVLTAISSGDRSKIRYAQDKYKKMTQKSKGGTDQLLEIIDKLTNPSYFENYVNVDRPYSFGSITPAQLFRNLLPQALGVNVYTDLDYKMPAADGDLIFERENYSEEIQKSMRKLKK